MPDKIVYKILEVPTNATIPDFDAETQAAIRSLDSHPGFEALLNKLRLQRSLIDNNLRKQRQDKIEDYYWLQALEFALDYAESFLKSEVKKIRVPKPREAFDEETEQFEKISAALEVIGRQ